MSETAEMVERVKKIIADALNSGQQIAFEDVARKVIEAMREPTTMMRDAACDVGPDTNSGCFSYDNADSVYQAMIDTALKPPE